MISATELPVSTPSEPVAEAISLKQDTARQKLAGWIMLLLAGEIVCLAAAVVIPTLAGAGAPDERGERIWP